MTAFTEEPKIERYENPERALQKALVSEINAILEKQSLNFMIMEGFGLDIAIFLEKGDFVLSKFIEVKSYVGARKNGVGVGNRVGDGNQINLLLQSEKTLQLLDSTIAWILGLGAHPFEARRYAIFNSRKAKNAVMAGVSRGKQNNLRISSFLDSLINWNELSNKLNDFLFLP